MDGLENVPIAHAESCPFDAIYKNKTTTELDSLKIFYEDQIKNKNKTVKLASVGIICDREVYFI